MKRPLDARFILITTSVGVFLLCTVFAGRDVYLRSTGLKQARAHANAAFQGEHVKTDISCVGFWRQELPSHQWFELYMESSNGRGMFVDWTYVAIKTSENRRYEHVEHFDYAEARAYGDAAAEFMPLWSEAKTQEERVNAVQERIQVWSHHPRVADILKLRLVNNFAALDSVLAGLGFRKQ
jgi:hypothetical protein